MRDRQRDGGRQADIGRETERKEGRKGGRQGRKEGSRDKGSPSSIRIPMTLPVYGYAYREKGYVHAALCIRNLDRIIS